MNFKLLKISSASVVVALSFSGCANLTPGENAAIAGTATALAVGLPLSLSGVSPAVTIPVTAGSAAAAAGGAYLISQNQATRRQRLLAEERARDYVSQSGLENKKSVRYIAVRTESERQSETAKIMIYDTETGTIVNDMVYTMSAVPPVGQVGNFGGYRALYIGTGR